MEDAGLCDHFLLATINDSSCGGIGISETDEIFALQPFVLESWANRIGYRRPRALLDSGIRLPNQRPGRH